MKLDAIKLGLSCALTWAVAVLVAGAIGTYLGWGGGLVKALGRLYLGYNVTTTSLIKGFIWAFLDAGIVSLVIGSIYNLMLGTEKK
jgi:hypothetical protein